MFQLLYLNEVIHESSDRGYLEFHMNLLVDADEGYRYTDFRIQPKLTLVDIHR